MDDDSHGWAAGSGWSVSRLDSPVSVHESMHYRLDRSTSFGTLLYIVELLHDHGLVDEVVLRELRDATRTVQESFAAFVSQLVFPDQEQEGDQQRYLDGLAALVSSTDIPYFQLHAAWAISRACMQVDVVTVCERQPLASINLAAFRSRDHPDERLEALRRHSLDFGPSIEKALGNMEENSATSLSSPSPLSARSLNVDMTDAWEITSSIFYDYVRGELENLQRTTTSYDENQSAADHLLKVVAIEHPGIEVPIESASEDSDRVWDALVALDAETLRLPTLRAYRVDLPRVGSIQLLSAGVGDDEHFHLAIRQPIIGEQYEWKNERPSGPVCLRRTLMTDEGPIVEFVDISQEVPRSLIDSLDHPLVVTVAESALREPTVARWWPELKDSAVLLADTPLVPRLRYWLSEPGRIFRYSVVSLPRGEADIPILIATLGTADGISSNPIVRPLSPHNVGTLRQGMAELTDSPGQAAEDPSLFDEIPMLSVALSHIVGEESVFEVVR